LRTRNKKEDEEERKERGKFKPQATAGARKNGKSAYGAANQQKRYGELRGRVTIT